jgi:hypothetical protein
MLRRVSSSCSARPCLQTQLRWFTEEKTKGSHFMKHLDLYARRDPQLAPYLLREVDIEYKRKCRKASYCFWVGVITILMSYQYRLQAEELSYLRQYAAYCRASQDARDEDDMERRRVFVTITNTIKDAFNRDQRWRECDVKACLSALE